MTADSENGLSLDELCVLTDLSKRTIRYYMQIGLVERPTGETRAARYGPSQLEALLKIRRWSQGGLSLERIRQLLAGEDAPAPERTAAPGSIEVWSHLLVADGVEVRLNPARATLTPEQVRQFYQAVTAAFETITKGRSPQ